MSNYHFENCNAAICGADTDLDYKKNVIWFPGEEVCKNVPVQKFQRIQERINKHFVKGKLIYPERAFTVELLEESGGAYNYKGIDPNA